MQQDSKRRTVTRLMHVFHKPTCNIAPVPKPETVPEKFETDNGKGLSIPKQLEAKTRHEGRKEFQNQSK